MNIQENFITNHYTAGRNGWNIDFIVLHTYDGPGTSLYNWFQNLSPNTSSHFGVWKDGTIEQLVRLEDTAHQAGNMEANYRSVGIEHQDDGDEMDSVRTNALYESSAQLCAHVYRLRGWDFRSMDNIKTHHDFTGGVCPGGLDIQRIKNRTYEILNPPIPQIDNYYRVLVNSEQQGAYLEKDFALQAFVDKNATKVTYKGKDITSDFKQIAMELKSQIKQQAESIENLQKQLEMREDIISELREKIDTLQTQIDANDKPVETPEEQPKFNLIKFLIDLVWKK